LKPGVACGESDECTWTAVRDVTTSHGFHATALHLLGLDHEKPTFRHNGANRRLTDVQGEAIRKVLA
jgi:hypothetical protein